MKRRSLALLPLALLLGAIPRAATPTIAIDASSPAGKVNPLLNGLMTEEINHAYDPGARRWRPNLIGYDGPGVYGSPSYHAITLFATHVGDEILKQTAKLMKLCTRQHDLVARIGGDEFAVVFWDKEGPRQPRDPSTSAQPGRLYSMNSANTGTSRRRNSVS